MRQEEISMLDQATRALRDDVPDGEAVSDSAAKVAQRLGMQGNHEVFSGVIRNCDDVRQRMDSYRAGTLSEARRLLVQAHLGECGLCLRHFREGRAETAVDWARPRVGSGVGSGERVGSTPRMHPHARGWALAFSCALLAAVIFGYKAYWQVPVGVRAEVQSIDGAAYLISAPGGMRLAPGAKLREGERMRTAGDSRAVLRLSDGSVVEVDQRSTLEVGARGRNTTVTLDEGALIVTAAHRTSGHLYVNTPDCRTAVTGTLFSINSGIKGSRVAVLQGSVDVAHAGLHALLHPGEQMATSDNLAPEPIDQAFAWSADRLKYIGLMAQLANVQHLIAQLAFPQSRYSSDLLGRMPDHTLLYIGIPNLGDYLSEANAIFQGQLSQSPELQQWWASGRKGHAEDVNALVERVHDVSRYLGNEVVIAGIGLGGQGNQPGIAVLAEVQRSGLEDELRRQFSSTAGGLVVLDEASLARMAATTPVHGGYALVREHEVVFSNSIATLKQFNAQLDAGASGFAAGGFGKEIAAAYQRGAGIILAADLHTMLQNRMNSGAPRPASEHALEDSGVGDLQYLIAEHRETDGVPQNHLNLQFAGKRQRVASWLATAAPIGSLNFVSPNAAVVVAALSKDPASIADDILEMASGSGVSKESLGEIDSRLQISVRDDLMANLGGDFLIALDGPILPTPSWKLVIEVNDPDRLERTLERIAQAVSGVQGGKAIAIEANTAGSQRYYAIHDVATGMVVANYTFADGFMIVAPQRALLMDALQIHSSGNSLGQSAAFRALLPRDQNENYSAVAYQNLSPVLTPLLSQFSGDSANAIRKLAADSRPTVICAWGKDSRIEAASDSSLFGFDFLTLGAVLNSRNKLSGQAVVR